MSKQNLRILNTKVSEDAYARVQDISRRMGMEVYGFQQMAMSCLLKYCDKDRQLDPMLRRMISIYDNFEGWAKATSVAGTGKKNIIQAIYFMAESGKRTMGAVMTRQGMMGSETATYNVQDMMEELMRNCFPALYKTLRRIGNQTDTHTLVETIMELAETYDKENDPDKEFIGQIFSDANRSDWGRTQEMIKYKNHKFKGIEYVKGPNIQQADLFAEVEDAGQENEDKGDDEV